MKIEGVVSGDFRTPSIGVESDVQHGETRISINDDHIISVHSPLWDVPYRIGDGTTFSDPRTDAFLRVAALHQFHHFTTRQLSLVEEFETRVGTGRIVRLGHMLDSAKLLSDLGATFEQTVQTFVSDLAHPAGSHLRGDFMVGDYEAQDTHDAELWNYIKNSGLLRTLKNEHLVEDDGRLVGSHILLKTLADPRNPRHEDIVECSRPDNNADRAQFTLHEGVLVHDTAEIREATQSIIRVETPEGERMAMRDVEAARLLFKLAVRHQSENWAEPVHRIMEELVLLPDRFLFCAADSLVDLHELQEYYPVDYTRTDEETWHNVVNNFGSIDPFIPNILNIAHAISAHQRTVSKLYIGDDFGYRGPVLLPEVSLKKLIQGREVWLV